MIKSHKPARRKKSRNDEQGYVLLTLLLMMALLAIFAAVVISPIAFDLQRDREEELIHRGVQYSRAIRAYYKKFGRYPTKLEDLESTSNVRFLRKRYKDPMNCTPQCQDFKILHFGEVKLSFSMAMGGGTIPGATAAGNMNTLSGNGGGIQASGIGGNGALGSSSITAVGQNSGIAAANNQDSGSNAQTPSSDGNATTPGGNSSDANNASGSSGNQPPNTTFGGAAIVGVASGSKKDTIREFNHKKKYNEWQFVYDPATDSGGLLMTPNQPNLQGFGQSNGALGPQNGNVQPNGGLGNGLPPAGMQNNPNLPTGPPETPPQPQAPPQQQ